MLVFHAIVYAAGFEGRGGDTAALRHARQSCLMLPGPFAVKGKFPRRVRRGRC